MNYLLPVARPACNWLLPIADPETLKTADRSRRASGYWKGLKTGRTKSLSASIAILAATLAGPWRALNAVCSAVHQLIF